jgi:hypothetical protein
MDFVSAAQTSADAIEKPRMGKPNPEKTEPPEIHTTLRGRRLHFTAPPLAFGGNNTTEY